MERIMKRLPIVTLFVLLIASLILSACAPAATSVPTMEPAPTQPPAPTQTPMAPMETPKPKDIVDTAVADGRFKTLVSAVQAAGLVDTLKGNYLLPTSFRER